MFDYLLQKLPENIARWLKGRDPSKMKLREADGGRDSLFSVQVVRTGETDGYLQSGWNHFADSHSFNIGYFLLLNYDSFNMLTIKVFDPIMCRKYYDMRKLLRKLSKINSVCFQRV